MLYYSIAGLTVKMDTFGMTRERAEKYRIDPVENPDIVISTQELIDSGFNYIEKWTEMDDDWKENWATLIMFCRKLIAFDGMRFHASAVVVDGKAYLFTADPGIGKSTHTLLWLNQFGNRAYILNDDKPIIRLIDGILYAFGSPWSGKYDISANIGVPIAGIAILERGDKNVISRCSGLKALVSIMKQLNTSKFKDYRTKMMELTDKLVTQVPIWKLECNMDPEAAIVSYEAMSGQKFIKENKE